MKNWPDEIEESAGVEPDKLFPAFVVCACIAIGAVAVAYVLVTRWLA